MRITHKILAFSIVSVVFAACSGDDPAHRRDSQRDRRSSGQISADLYWQEMMPKINALKKGDRGLISPSAEICTDPDNSGCVVFLDEGVPDGKSIKNACSLDAGKVVELVAKTNKDVVATVIGSKDECTKVVIPSQHFVGYNETWKEDQEAKSATAARVSAAREALSREKQ